MSESSIVLPIAVEDAKALAELKKVQAALGACGKESAELNKTIATAMQGLADKSTAALTDIQRKTVDFSKTWSELNQKLEVGNKVIALFRKGVEFAEVSAEMRRLHNAIPVERLNRLRGETQGAVSEFELLKRAAKEMGLKATDGMDATTTALQRSLVAWENFFDRAKALIGDFVGETIIWVGKLANSLDEYFTGEKTPETIGDAVAAKARAAADASYRGLGGNRLQPGAGTAYGDARQTPEWQWMYDAELARAKGEMAGSTGAPGRALPSGGIYRPGKGWDALLKPSDSIVPSLGGAYGDLVLWNAKNRLPRKGTKKKYNVGGVYDEFFAGTFEGLDDGASSYGAGEAGSSALQGLWQSEWLTQGPTSSIASIGMGMADGGGEGLGNAAKQSQRMQGFTDDLQDRTKLLGGAFGALSDGLAASVEAAITGSESIGKAWMKASAMALKAIATEQSVRALVAGASAIGALAIGSPAAALAFGKEAAMRGIAAAAAGIGAAALGAASGGGGGGAAVGAQPSSVPGGGNYASTGGGSSGGGQTVNVYVTGAIAAGDYQKLGAEINRAVRSGRASGRVGDEQTITTRFE